MRGKLGESFGSVQKYDALPENVTTPSLEALQAYTLGNQTIDVANDYAAGIPLFERAVSLDPNFALAYLRLGQSYQPLSELDRSAENTRKAYEMRERTSESEKLAISSFKRCSSPEILRQPALLISYGRKPTPVMRSHRLTCGSLIPSWEITRKVCRGAGGEASTPAAAKTIIWPIATSGSTNSIRAKATVQEKHAQTRLTLASSGSLQRGFPCTRRRRDGTAGRQRDGETRSRGSDALPGI